MGQNRHKSPKTAAKGQKTAAKGPFGHLPFASRVLQWFYLPLLWCHYRSIAAVTKGAIIDRPFSSTFGLLWWAENCRQMRLPPLGDNL